MTTLDLDALERAARAAADGDWRFAAGQISSGAKTIATVEWGRGYRPTMAEKNGRFIEAAQPSTILSLISDYRALQERVERAEKALRPFADFIEQFDAGMIEGVRSMEPDGGAVPDDEILQLISPDSQCRATTGEMAFGRKTPVLPPKQITNGHLRAARAYFAARTKAGEPYEQE